jgi:hypothetical protein
MRYIEDSAGEPSHGDGDRDDLTDEARYGKVSGISKESEPGTPESCDHGLQYKHCPVCGKG